MQETHVEAKVMWNMVLSTLKPAFIWTLTFDSERVRFCLVSAIFSNKA